MKPLCFAAAIAAMWFETAFSFGTPAYNEASRCIITEDPYAVPAYVPSFAEESTEATGLWVPTFGLTLPQDAGKCVEQNYYRPALLLSSNERPEFNGLDVSQYKFVANIRHDDGWYVAAIPYLKAAGAAYEVAIKNVPFVGLRAGHAEMRIYFSEPIVLVPQWPLDAVKSISVNELFFTVNPTGFNNEITRKDPLRNIDGSLLVVRGIQTREARLKWSFVDHYGKTETQISLNLNAEEISDYLSLFIEMASEYRLTERFLVTTLNCNNAQFDIIDRVLAHRYQGKISPIDPEYAQQDLAERGLVNTSFVMSAFEEEPWAVEYFKMHGRRPLE